MRPKCSLYKGKSDQPTFRRLPFNGDQHIVGNKLSFDSTPHVIVGVMAELRELAASLRKENGADLFLGGISRQDAAYRGSPDFKSGEPRYAASWRLIPPRNRSAPFSLRRLAASSRSSAITPTITCGVLSNDNLFPTIC